MIRGHNIRSDEIGRVCLNDIHKAGGYSVNQKPHDWGALTNTLRLIEFTASKMFVKSKHLSKDQIKSIYYARRGRDGEVWAHPNLALAYAKYLSPSLHYEVNEVFLRYKSGDATLADEVLQKASPQANEWAGVRAMGRAERNNYTGILAAHGVKDRGYANCTNAIYENLFGAKAKELRTQKGVKNNVPLRDHMSTKELVYTMASEHLAGERIVEVNCRGNIECVNATAKSASFIRQAIEADRADRRKSV